jgi:hypothetical protein
VDDQRRIEAAVEVLQEGGPGLAGHGSTRSRARDIRI